MNDRELKTIEFKINNSLQLRNNCISIVVLLTGGIIGLVLSELNILKLILIIVGILVLAFLLLITYVTDKDVDILIKELEQNA